MKRDTPLLTIFVVTFLLALWAGLVLVRPAPFSGMELLSNGSVHEVEPDGPAAAAGLQVGDQVLAVDGRALHLGWSLFGEKGRGERVAVTVRRAGQVRQAVLTLGTVSRGEGIFSVERLVVGLIICLTGLLVFMLRAVDPAARIFFLLSQATAGMLFGEILDPRFPATAVLTDFLRYLLAPLLLHFFVTFPRPLSARYRRALLYAAYGGYVVISLGWLAALVFRLDVYASGFWVVPRLFELATLVLALAVLFRPQPTASRDTLRRRRILVAGMVMGVTPSVATMVSLMAADGAPALPFVWTVPALALVPLVYAYAVYRDEVEQADLILNRSMVYFLLTILLLGLYTVVFLGLDVVFDVQRSWGHLVAGGALVILGSTMFGPLRKRLQQWVDRLFYGSWYDYRSFVQSVSPELGRSVDLVPLMTLLQAASERMRFHAGAFLWPREDAFVVRGSYGLDKQTMTRLRLPRDGALVRHLEATQRPVAREALLRALEGRLTEREQAVLERPALAYWMPLVARGKLQSILVMGLRQGEEDLDMEDAAILSTLSTQAAIACENIALLESLRARLAEVETMRDELAETQARLAEGREAERLHLARELHDGPVQDLYALSHELERITSARPDGGAGLDVFRETLQGVARTLRDICVELRPPLLSDFGLDTALGSYVARFLTLHPGLEVELDLMPHGPELPERHQLALFRICQEALNNAVQHAAARRVHIRYEADAEQIVLKVEDDGRGFQVPERFIEFGRRGHLGLLGAMERAEAIGGTLEVRSRPGGGTLLRVVAPLPEAAAPAHRSAVVSSTASEASHAPDSRIAGR